MAKPGEAKRRSGFEGQRNPWPWATLNDQGKAEAIRLLALGLSVAFTAKRIGRTPDMIYRWATDDPAFAAALNALNSEIDAEVMELRERVRRAAGQMLDNLIELAGEENKNQRERNAALKTYWADVYGPTFAPRTKDGTGVAPAVYVNAQQAALLFASPEVLEGMPYVEVRSEAGRSPGNGGGAGGAGRSDGVPGHPAQPPGQVPAAGAAEGSAAESSGPHEAGVEVPAGEGMGGAG